MAKTSNTEAAARKLNIYKVTTAFVPVLINEADDGVGCRVDFVRAKTKAGATALVAAEYIKADLATTEELIVLAKIAVKEAA